MSAEVSFLRHTVATVAYRAGKALRDAPAEFAGYRAAEGSRTPAEILAHMGDLYDWAASMVEGRERWRDSTPLAWDREVDRFFTALGRFDELLAGLEANGVEPDYPLKRMFQGPVADSLNHTGQLTMLRRLAGSPIRGENYARAEIEGGRTGREQVAPRREFD